MRCVPGGTSTLCKPSTAHLQIIRQSLRGTGTHTFFSPSLSLCISLSHCTVQLLDSTQDMECHLCGKSSVSPLRAPVICRVGWSSSKSSGAHLSLGASLSVLLSVCVWGRVRREKEGRELGGGLTSGDEIKRLTYTFDLKNSFRLRTISYTLLLLTLRADVTLVMLTPCKYAQVWPLL